MPERIRQITYSGIGSVPEIISKRIRVGDADQRIVDTRPAIVVAGGHVPERTRVITIFDAEPTSAGEHQLYATINRGQGSLISVVEARGPTAESARWLLGRNHNIGTIQKLYADYQFVVPNRLEDDGLTADG